MVVTDGGVRFDGRATGTPESTWAGADLPGRAPALDLVGIRRLLVVSAHPDDETLGAGGLLARGHASGAEVRVLVASDGEGSHPHSRTTTPAALGRRRRSEMTSATAHLAPGGGIDWLGLPDGQLADREGDLTAEIGRWLGDGDAGTVVVSPWRADGHPDHEAVARSVARVLAGRGGAAVHLEFPIWAWLWAGPQDPRLQPRDLRVLRLTAAEQRAKARAIADHRSQIAPLGDDPGDEAVLTPEFLDHFRRPWEIFLPAAGAVA